MIAASAYVGNESERKGTLNLF